MEPGTGQAHTVTAEVSPQPHGSEAVARTIRVCSSRMFSRTTKAWPLAAVRLDALRTKLVTEAGLPVAQASRVRGTTEDEIKADRPQETPAPPPNSRGVSDDLGWTIQNERPAVGYPKGLGERQRLGLDSGVSALHRQTGSP